MQLLLLAGSAASMVPMGSALSTTASPPSMQEEGVASMAVATGKCARLKAAALLHTLVVYVASMVHVDRASMMAATLTPDLDLNIAANTAVEGRRSRAPWRAAPPPLNARVSAPNTAAVQANATLQAAPTRWSAPSRPARRTAG